MLDPSIPSPEQKHDQKHHPRDIAAANIRSPAVDIKAGECVSVPNVTPRNVDSRSVSVEVGVSSTTPYDRCNITLHEVPGCIDEPLVEADVVAFSARTPCVSRNFAAFDYVWVRLECERGFPRYSSPFRPYRSPVSRTRPARRLSSQRAYWS